MSLRISRSFRIRKHKEFPSLKELLNFDHNLRSMCVKMQNWEQRHAGLVVLRLSMKKLRRVFSEFPSRGLDQNAVEFDENVEETKKIPKDVKEGHFAVIAVKGGKPKRFILELSYLRNPAFLRLLEQAKEEYGFHQTGALTVPCQPEELEKILEDRIKKIASAWV
ncbi:hypothetical protein QUC31_011103 [Theobroma cacao]